MTTIKRGVSGPNPGIPLRWTQSYRILSVIIVQICSILLRIAGRDFRVQNRQNVKIVVDATYCWQSLPLHVIDCCSHLVTGVPNSVSFTALNKCAIFLIQEGSLFCWKKNIPKGNVPNGIVQSLHFTNSSNCLLCVQSCHPAPTRASWPNKCESRMAEIPWSDQITKCRRIKVFLWVLLEPMPQDAGLWKNYLKKK